MATYILVHGAFQGGWVYERVSRKLREAGHDVYTPTLTGLGERSHLVDRPINLDTHVQDIINVIKFNNLRDIILCGHSYGGMVITGVAALLGKQIRSLIYIDAYVPGNGQSLLDITGPETALAFLKQASDNGRMLPPIPAALFNVNKNDAAWVDALSVPHPVASFIQGSRGGIDAVMVEDRRFIYAADNGGDWFASTYARLKKQPDWRVDTLKCGHCIMLDEPEALLDILLMDVT